MWLQVRFETAGGKDSKTTSVVEGNLSPYWDETMTFDFDIASQYQLDTQKAYIEVWDSDRVKDDQIGSFELDLGFLWRQKDHELYRRWLSLSDSTGTFLGVQGYLRITACLLPEGAEPKTVRDEIPSGDELQDVLMGSSIETIESVVKVNCFRADGLPDMDRTGGNGEGTRCDPFVAVKIDGVLGSTLHKDGTTTPEWNETLMVPVKQPKHGPNTSGRVRISVFDHDGLGIAAKLGLSATGDGFLSKAVSGVEAATGLDVDGDGTRTRNPHHNLTTCCQMLKTRLLVVAGALGADGTAIDGALEKANDLIGSTDIEFDAISEHWKKPCWVNLYGAPSSARDFSVSNLMGEAKRAVAEMESGAIEASAYRGRVLLSAAVQKNVQDPKLLCKGQLPIPPKKTRHPPQAVKFKLRVCVLEGSSLPHVGNQKLRVEVCHGLAEPKQTTSRNWRSSGSKSKSKTGRVQWYNELDVDASYPNDIMQIPDIFINLLDEKGNRLAYRRIPVLDTKTNSINTNDIWDLTDMENFDGLLKASWYDLKRDVFGPLKKAVFPGQLSICIGFVRTDGLPIGNRMNRRQAIRKEDLDAAGQARVESIERSMAGDGPHEAPAGSDEQVIRRPTIIYYPWP